VGSEVEELRDDGVIRAFDHLPFPKGSRNFVGAGGWGILL